MKLCKVNNNIHFYTDFSMETCYYLWQVMAKEFRSATFDRTREKMGGLQDAAVAAVYLFWMRVEFFIRKY